MANSAYINFVFHDNTNTTGVGNELNVTSGCQTINIEIISTGTFSVTFEGQSLSGAWYPIAGANLNTLNVTSVATDNTSLWQIDLTSLVAFRCNLTANTGVTTITGRVVA